MSESQAPVRPIVSRYSSAAALAGSASEEFLQLVLSSTAGRPFHLAISGGRIAKTFFVELAQRARPRRAPLAAVHFFWADERCVPPADPESNFKLAHENLFLPLEIDANQVHRIPGELAKESAASSAEQEIRRIVPLDARGRPILDLVLLGMGEDGHIASLFPGAGPLGPGRTSRTGEILGPDVIYRGVVGPKPPPERVTLTYSALSAARQIWVLASGPGKEDALSNSLNAATDLSIDSAKVTPLGFALRIRADIRILTDLR